MLHTHKHMHMHKYTHTHTHTHTLQHKHIRVCVCLTSTHHQEEELLRIWVCQRVVLGLVSALDQRISTSPEKNQQRNQQKNPAEKIWVFSELVVHWRKVGQCSRLASLRDLHTIREQEEHQIKIQNKAINKQRNK